MSDSLKISVVVLNWNGKSFLEKFHFFDGFEVGFFHHLREVHRHDHTHVCRYVDQRVFVNRVIFLTGGDQNDSEEREEC